MPGPAVHYLVAQDFRAAIRRTGGAAAIADLEAMLDHPEALAVGAMGPDFLFFNLEDLDPDVASAVRLFLEVTEFIEDLTKALEDLVPDPLMEALEAVDDLASNSVLFNEVEQTLNEMAAVIGVLSASVQSWLIALADDTFDVFGIFEHPIQDATPRGDWWWFDTLHYARTGKYTQALLQGSVPGSLLRSYSLGYLTHYGADIVGHPYVNMMVGGPFRTYGQRHKFVENFHDTWAWNLYRNQEFTRSRMHTALALSAHANPRMPEGMARYIAQTIRHVYGDDFGTPPEPDHISSAYALFYRWLRSTTETGMPPEPWSYSLSAELQEAWEQFTDNAGAIVDVYTDAVNDLGGPTSIFGLLAALIGAIIAGFALVIALIDFVAGTLLTIAGAPVREFIAITYSILYSAYLHLRYVVALKGLAHPLRADLTKPEAIHTTHPLVADLNGGIPSMIQGTSPKIEFNLPAPLNLEDHLFVPTFIQRERESTTLAPDSYYAQPASYYIDGPVGQSAAALNQIFNGMDVADASDPAFRALMQVDSLGSAVEFCRTAWLRIQEGQDLPNLSLDGDRGIAWPCFDIRHPVANPLNVDDVDNLP